MKIILAFDSFKECLTAMEACEAAREGVLEVHPDADVIMLPLSDGGEGLSACLATALNLRQRTITTHDALMRQLTAQYALTPDGTTAVMEMAATCGLALIPPTERDVMRATTYGVGEMMLDAVRQGVRRIFVGIGGSATCDGGRGMIDALKPHLAAFDGIEVIVACDVTNPLYGPEGAAFVFAPQKGATPDQVVLLDHRLRDFARECEAGGASPALAHHPGAGAAGGLGYGLMALLGARLTSGIESVLDLLRFDAHLQDATFVITGEGKSDRQTLHGKVPMGVLRRANAQGVPTMLLSGAIEDAAALTVAGFHKVRSINDHDSRPLPELLRPEVAMSNLRSTVRSLLS